VSKAYLNALAEEGTREDLIEWLGKLDAERDAAVDQGRALVAALEQTLWHYGSDADRKALLDAGKGWKTDTFELIAMIRVALTTAGVSQ
jgi:hypothetical protein